MRNTLNLFILAAGIVLGGIAGTVLLPYAVAVEFVIGGVVGLVLASILVYGLDATKQKAAAAASAVAAAAGNRYDPQRDLARALEALVRENTVLRTSHGISPTVLDGAERLIDKLNPLVVRLYETYPNEETTWNIAAVATKHLPGMLGTYRQTTVDMRPRVEEETLSALGALEQEVTTVATMLDEYNLEGARAAADSIKSRFGRQDFINPA